MSLKNRSNFLETTLDPDLLLTPFKVKTNWHVITGAPSSGKSTLIDLIEKQGFKIQPEPARQYIEQELAKGFVIKEVQQDLPALNQSIANFHLEKERLLSPAETIFLDRGLPDFLAYHRIHGMNPNELLVNCFHHRYRSVFILERLPFQQDGIRYEDDQCAEFHLYWLLKDYRSLGYNPVIVPILPPESRLNFIFNQLSDLELL